MMLIVFFGEEKHIFNEELIETFSKSNNTNDYLAVAISYLNEGAKFRLKSIEYFEKYLSSPSSQTYFSEWQIYSSLAELYEKEYFFDKAIFCLDKLIQIDNDSNVTDYIRKGNVLIKKDIELAIDYYKKIMKKKLYIRYKETFDNAYKNVLLKKQKGYVYRPRNKK